MLAGHPAIAQVHTIDRDWKKRGLVRTAARRMELLRALRARRYDLLVHLTEHPRGLTLARLLRPRSPYACARERENALAVAARFHALLPRCPRRPRPRRRAEPRRAAPHRRLSPTRTSASCWCRAPRPGARRRAARRARARVARVRAGASGIALAVQVLAGRAHGGADRPLVADGCAVVVTGAPDERERALVDAMLAALSRQPRARRVDLYRRSCRCPSSPR